MSMLIFVVTLSALCAWLVHTIGRHRDQPASSSDVTFERQTPTGTCHAPGDDLIGVTRPAWTPLDDHQLNRLLKDSSP